MPTDLYQRINLDNYTRTGEGATAVAYTHNTEPRRAKFLAYRKPISEGLAKYTIDMIDS